MDSGSGLGSGVASDLGSVDELLVELIQNSARCATFCLTRCQLIAWHNANAGR